MALKRALHLIHTLDFGGTETQLRLIAECQDTRYEHSFCALKAGGSSFQALQHAGAEVHLLGVDGWQHPLSLIARIRSLLTELRPQVVHCHAAEANLFGLSAAWLARSPARVGEEVGLPDHGVKAKLAYRFVYGLAHRIIAVSDAVARRVIDLNEAPTEKIVRLHNPVRLPSHRAKRRQVGEPLRIACVGRLEAWKNPMALIDAVAQLQGLELELFLIGSGSQQGEIEAKIDALGLGKRVRLCGYVEQPETIVATCHLYIQPSPSEGFGIALVEAMGCSLPVIAAETGGAREFIDHEVNGWLVSEPNPESLAQAIKRAAALDPSALEEMGKRARDAISGRFDADRYVRQLERVYDDILRQKGAA